MTNQASVLKQLVYSSIAVIDPHDHALEKLLQVSRENNSRDDITGILLYRNGAFMQVLEGPEEKVDATYQRITEDPRHTSPLVLYEETIQRRDFADWAMAYNGNESEPVEGLSDFLNPYRSQDEQAIPEGAVKMLLSRFKEIHKR